MGRITKKDDIVQNQQPHELLFSSSYNIGEYSVWIWLYPVPTMYTNKWGILQCGESCNVITSCQVLNNPRNTGGGS